MATKDLLFEPVHIGGLQLSSRIVMAPLTRCRADKDHVHHNIAAEYYAQRASYPGTLLITEATTISARAGNQRHVPGIYTAEQVVAWKKIVDSVHAKGSHIYLQIWGLGRASDAALLKEETGLDVFSSSAIPMSQDAPTPREMTEQEILEIISDFAAAAKKAVHDAGFDGVEIHAANGYLIDQFTQDTCNKRTDKWGGSVENRSRFALEVAKAVAACIGPEKTGIRLSPFSSFQGMRMADPIPQFTHLIGKLKELDLAYLHLVEPRISGGSTAEGVDSDSNDFAIDIWNNQSPVILAGGFDPSTARTTVSKYQDKDILIAFGRHFLANPDLVFRIRDGIHLNKYDRSTFYTPERPEGYIDYPFSPAFKERESS